MKETVEVKIGEKVISVDAIALFSLAVKGRDALKSSATDYENAGQDTMAEVYREHIEKCRPFVYVLADYVYELLKK